MARTPLYAYAQLESSGSSRGAAARASATAGGSRSSSDAGAARGAMRRREREGLQWYGALGAQQGRGGVKKKGVSAAATRGSTVPAKQQLPART